MNALNRLGATATMERYLSYLVGIAASVSEADPAGVSHQRQRAARRAHRGGAARLRGMGPVRVGNDAWRQIQHDVYGSAILAATHVFFDERLDPWRRHRRCSSAWSRSAAARVADARPARRRPVGAARQHARAHVLERDVLGGVRPARADREAPRARPSARSSGASEADRIRAFVDSIESTR